MNDLIVELCSGDGKFPGDHNVIRIDVNRKMKPTIIADIRYLPLRKDAMLRAVIPKDVRQKLLEVAGIE
jgi:hypothetical protein